MARFIKNKKATIGQMPGEPIFVGRQKTEKASIHVIEYNETTLNEYDQDIKKPIEIKDDHTTWININGLHDVNVLKSLGKNFDIHSLAIEDIANTGQRSKLTEYPNHLYFIIKMMRIDSSDNLVHSEQLSLIIGKNYLISFQEKPGDVFEVIRNRIRNTLGRIRKLNTDYLAYSLLDCVVDNYTTIVEQFGEEIEEMENNIQKNPNKIILGKINDKKREMNYLKKTFRPIREGIALFSRLDSDLIFDSTRPFIKNLLDNMTQTLEITDAYRDMLSDYLEIYNTVINNRLNEIMKVLTIFSAIFIPLTFIAGIYGTNFVYFPELHFKYSYPIFWGVLIIIAIIMLGFFKKKKWL